MIHLIQHSSLDKITPDSIQTKVPYESDFAILGEEIGFQVGAGFMVGSPYQTDETIAKDLMFLKELSPHMVGIGPFISHKDTQFKDFENGSV